MCSRWCLFFFFQAEDGIRDVAVTGVQTCALPISKEVALLRDLLVDCDHFVAAAAMIGGISYFHEFAYDLLAENERITATRSEERRVGKEGRSRWSPYH